ncbi:NADPH:quinone oxidoreductase MdaB [Acinetobacter calcoaceticus]|jgi:modulator of drug activity B|uniref:NAD(P)H-dependent oxidoreductase n=1 Tax=Acinetobacter TaxID=469 RepID=UPI0002EEEC53|nr:MULTISPECIES: NAD(P)H-dependent oxidoreductase [Acinetobacter]MDS7936115.1 NAD(P)H-dependent oxidoreductase [Acinetobacter sp. V91_4B]MDS7964276.1 NAD(P)H-dependent oxidoreductase [Acinetobacter sp. V91_7]MDS8026197.1 NAD(P)H-dependent oxidoreductase [Acinetobacter sp. V91_13]UGQ27946.1 NAD(P)H-dependent oxidoreductase [Acinetobacter calcoaceticus]
MKKVLIINTHQFYEGMSTGTLNNSVVEIMKETMTNLGCEVQLTHIEKGYDINEEVNKHLWADLIITQSPVYWFGSPWIYKKYVDEVFTEGLKQGTFLADDGRTRNDPSKQYGTGGKLFGKKYMLSLTWNAPREAFNNFEQKLFDGRSVDDVFIHNTSNYKFCGVEVLPTFSFFDVFKEPQISKDIENLKQKLIQIFD